MEGATLNAWSLWGVWDETCGGEEFPLVVGTSADDCFAHVLEALRQYSIVHRSRIGEVWLKRWIGNPVKGYWQYVRMVTIGKEISRINKREHEARKRTRSK